MLVDRACAKEGGDVAVGSELEFVGFDAPAEKVKQVSIDEFLACGLKESEPFSGYRCFGCKQPSDLPGTRLVYWRAADGPAYIVWHKVCWDTMPWSPQLLDELTKTELDREVLPEAPKPIEPPLKAPARMHPVKELNWLKFLGVSASALPLNLVQQAADFYLLEFSATVLGRGRERYATYARWLAELYAKYMLAACLGEFRHRPEAVPAERIIAVPRGTARELAHDRATIIWGMGSRAVAKALALLDKGFSHPAWQEIDNVGGKSWATIARVTGLYAAGRIPPGAFVDTAYNVVHNSGKLFDKGRPSENSSLRGRPLFSKEDALRNLLVRKAQDGLDALVKYASPEVKEVYLGEADA